MTSRVDNVKAWAEIISIPTYGIGQPDKNPLFLEKRVYQGSSGVVYPYPVIDRVFDEDLNLSNRIHCHYMIGMGQLGLGNAEEAQLHFDRVLTLDANHQGAIVHRMLTIGQ
jgi:hypothetical protein